MRITELISEHAMVVQKAEQPSPRGIAFTFNNFGQTIQPGHGFGGEWLLRLGFDLVAFKTEDDAWWQNLTEAQLNHIRNSSERDIAGNPYPLRFSYASSMGAYGAILFADRFNVQKAIALSPQYDIRTAHDTRWSAQAASIQFVHEIDRTDLSACRVYVFYDPHNTDAWHADHIARIAPDCVLVKLPFAGHPVGHFLQQAGVLQDAIQAVITNDTDDALWRILSRSKLRAKRRASAQYFWSLADRALVAKRYGLALALIDRAIALAPAVPDFYLTRSVVLEHAREWDRAIESVHSALPLLNDTTYANERLAYLTACKERHSQG
jgi:hypothetical protein